MSLGRSIKLFLVDGTPRGLIRAEIMNWTGTVTLVSRLRLAEYIQREEEDKTAVYVLTGPSTEEYGADIAYIGETDNIIDRLKYHNSASTGKEFWDVACVITSKDANLTKAHVKYLESKLIYLAQQCRRYTLENSKLPIYTAIPESDQADMEYFIQQIQLILPVLGINIFQEQTPRKTVVGIVENSTIPNITQPQQMDETDSEVFELQQVKARAQVVGGEFLLLKGSFVKKTRQPSDPAAHLLNRYLKEGRIVDSGATDYELVEDIAFRSPSGASGLALGRSSNGRTDWKMVGAGVTFAQWEENKTQNAIPISEVA